MAMSAIEVSSAKQTNEINRAGMMMDEILIVDDESILIEMLQWQLQEYAFTVHTAGSGDEALAILHDKMIPIVISDIRMPDMDGIELITKAKKNGSSDCWCDHSKEI